MRRPLIVGLTGGIASGKTTVANLLAALDVPVIDADVLARELVEPGQPALDEIVIEFGRGVLKQTGELDRAKLRTMVFHDPEKRARLEGILHPRIRQETNRRLRTLDAPYCVLCIPLLLESNQQDLVDRVLVVDTSPEIQIQRTQERDGTPRETIEGILQAQVGRSERLAAADDVIENMEDLFRLQEQVVALHRRYMEMAEADLPATGKL